MGLLWCSLNRNMTATMGAVLTRVFGTYYLRKIRHEDKILHYKRTPTWRSLAIFIVLFILTHIISTKAEVWSLGIICYLLGVYFCYIATEKYEECIFDKSRGTVSLMNARFLEKHFLGYRKQIVSELGEIVWVTVESQEAVMGAKGLQVVVLFLSGLTLSLTAQCTYGDRREHEEIAREIKRFLDLPTAGSHGDKDREESKQKKED